MRTIILSLLALTCQQLFSQDFNPEIYRVGKKYPGYVIKLTGDTVHGFIEAKDRCSVGGIGQSNQTKCEFYLNENDRKATEKYGPKDIKGYMIADKFYKSIPYSGGLVKSNNFCLRVADGRIAHYVWYSTKDGFINMNKGPNESWEDYDKRRYDVSNVYQKLEEDPFQLETMIMSFAKKMSAIVSDYPDLSKKIADKEKGYKVDAFFAIIEEYNKHFESK